TRAYLLSGSPQFLAEYQTATTNILPALDKLTASVRDNPVQIANVTKLRKAVEQRLSEFARGVERVKNNDVETAVTALRNGTSTGA
ncbi:CHASE3 domain-containing protein, partial [Klebsiella pneumoniae]|uniref:CHASE3 domain-containing protein n=1 Tax=Klebsiella pneumoniae TaxID=573 RepID=UPI0038550276